MARSLSFGVALVLSLSMVSAAQDSTTKRATVTRAPTCISGLREYKSMADVPQPYQIVRVPIGGAEVQGMRQITSLDDLVANMRRGAADSGATGIVLERGGGTDGGFSSVGRTVPVFVPADSVRAATACKKT